IRQGAVMFEGHDLLKMSDDELREIRGSRIGFVFQDPMTSLNPVFTVGYQLREPLIAHMGLNKQQANIRAAELLELVGIPDAAARLRDYPHQFSGGMRQRVVIALALCSEPQVIIADEPTTALDVSIQAQILDLIKDLAREQQVGVILITHDMGVIADTTDRVTVMYRGQVVETGATKLVLGKPNHAYTQSLIAAVPRPTLKLHRFPLISYGGRITEFHIDDLARNWNKPDIDPARPLYRIEDLTKRFLQKPSLIPSRRRYFTAVDKVSFDIRQGEVFGIVGESGSGKSTIARMIAGLYKPDGGTISFDGQKITGQGGLADYRRQIQMIFQDPYSSLNPRMRVDAIVAEPARHHRLLEGKALRARVDELLDRVGLGASAGLKYPHEFSGGQRQRISIARALATQPRFLICDEPTSALDVSIQAQILNILKDLQQHLNLTMLFISHDLPVVRQMCDRVAVMKNGQLVEVQNTETLFNDPQHPYSKELLSLMPRLDGLATKGITAQLT
ncbi:MAG: ABC transporter ATP-binding protein, partial [Marinosulfonomonas sp.]|nr:ABC transporter ATP-binding protein [Marinosulfonomonas sp.]